jgi:ferritin heavy chain
MLLKAAVNANASLFNSENTRLIPLLQRGSKLDRIAVSATKGSNNNRVLTGVLFEPFEEVKKELDLVPIVPQDSLARHKFHVDSESAINEQIKFVFVLLLIFLIIKFNLT